MTKHASIAFVAAALCGLASVAQADQLADIMSRKELRCGTFADVPSGRVIVMKPTGFAGSDAAPAVAVDDVPVA